MKNSDSRRDIVNLAVGLTFGYSIGFILVLLGGSSILYYLGGLLLLFSLIASLIFILSLAAMYWDIKKQTKKGLLGRMICRYDQMVSSVASIPEETSMDAESKEGTIDIEYKD